MTTHRKIKDLIADGAILEVQDGNHGEKHPTSADYVEEGIPFVMARDVHDGYVDLDSCKKIRKELGDSLRVGFARTGDILLTHKGTVGEVAIVPQIDEYLMLTPQVTYYRTNPTKLLNKYLKYAFISPYFRDQLFSFSAQSTRPYIGITSQKELRIEVQAPTEQRQIAGILSAYDDLIENNRHRVRVLEELARAIYREWFVNFRFPGHESIQLIESSLGLIPEGWQVTRLAEVLDCQREPTRAGAHLDDRLYVPIECLPRRSLALLEANRPQEARSSLQLFEKGNILFGAMRPYFHKVAIAPFAGVTRTTCFVLRPRQADYAAFSTMTMSEAATVQYATAHSQGATIPYAIWDGSLSEMPIVLPPREVVRRFEAVASTMLDFIAQTFFRFSNLRKTRDLILPKLLSGDVDLSYLVTEPNTISA
jgi:type I restriction enzyme S subunit